MDPERLEEIRYFNIGNAPWDCQSWMSPAINELLAEIDRLKKELEDQRKNHLKEIYQRGV